MNKICDLHELLHKLRVVHCDVIIIFFVTQDEIDTIDVKTKSCLLKSEDDFISALCYYPNSFPLYFDSFSHLLYTVLVQGIQSFYELFSICQNRPKIFCSKRKIAFIFISLQNFALRQHVQCFLDTR